MILQAEMTKQLQLSLMGEAGLDTLGCHMELSTPLFRLRITVDWLPFTRPDGTKFWLSTGKEV